MRIEKKSAKLYLLIHAVLVGMLLLFPLYRIFTELLPARLVRCFLHDRMMLYCPFCGGTRAIGHLLRLDVFAAWNANPLVVLLSAFLLMLDLVALIRLLRGKRALFVLPKWSWIALLAVTVFYGILRNYLMIAHGYDPLGDLGVFWQL